MLLRATIRKLKRLCLALAAYEYHSLANKAASKLRLHSSNELKDIGLTRGEVKSAAHSKCPMCHPKIWAEWTTDI